MIFNEPPGKPPIADLFLPDDPIVSARLCDQAAARYQPLPGRGAVFSRVIGERAPSFPDLSTGETAARPLILAGENVEGAKYPPWISPKKRPARKPQTEENVASPGQYYNETVNKYK
jgi:hypothetical protein